MAQQALQLDPRIEDALEHHRTSTGLSHRKVAMWMFLGGDTMFFGALLATFLVYQNNIVEGITREEAFSSLWLVSIMAFVLLASSFTMVLGLAAARRGDQRMMRIWLLATAACGIFFIGAQGFEFYSLVVHEDLTPQTNLFGASFMILTGFHGAHVTLGIIWLVAAALMVRLDPTKDGEPMFRVPVPSFPAIFSGIPKRAPGESMEARPRHRRFLAFLREQVAPPPAAPSIETLTFEEFEVQRLKQERVLNVEIAGLYWHFVDVVWVVIFTVVYLFS